MRRRASWIAWASIAGLSLACSPPAPPPNVIVLSIDTLRADHMGLYGYARDTTPALDAFADDAVVFDAFFNAGGTTLPSHASLFTSLYPSVHGVGWKKALRSGETTLAEVLREHGYATAGFTDVDWLTRKFGFDQGFDAWDERGGGVGAILPRVDRWLAERDERPFFLFVHVYDVHSTNGRLPYEAPGAFRDHFTEGYAGDFDGCQGERCATSLLLDFDRRIRAGEIRLSDVLSDEDLAYLVGLYDGGIRYVDAQLGAWFARLEGAGLYENTVLVVLSDHGEEFGEHGQLLHAGRAYEEFIRIPLLVKLPGSAHAGRRVEGLASMVDVLPTVLEAVGIDPPERRQGRSLLAWIEDEAPTRPHVAVHGGVRGERFKLSTADGELYDLSADPAERHDVADDHPDVVDALRQQQREHERLNAALIRPDAAPQDTTLSEEERARLRSLGYVE